MIERVAETLILFKVDLINEDMWHKFEKVEVVLASLVISIKRILNELHHVKLSVLCVPESLLNCILLGWLTIGE